MTTKMDTAAADDDDNDDSVHNDSDAINDDDDYDDHDDDDNNNGSIYLGALQIPWIHLHLCRMFPLSLKLWLK